MFFSNGNNVDYDKKYVEVVLTHSIEGVITPTQIAIDDDKYEITKVLDRQASASLKVGGIGVRYHIVINNQKTFLFYDKLENKWFVEYKKK